VSGLESGDGIRAGPLQDGAWASIYGLHGPVDDGPCDVFFLFFLFFYLFWPCIIGLYSHIFLFLYITKTSTRLTL
jgi:hypothetical protein